MNLEKQIQYDSFGHVLSDSNPNFEIPFGFAGGLYDKHTKLIRFGARDYDPETGRWTSKEPLGFAGSRNFYVYTKGDPVNFVDRTGLYDIGWGDYVETPDRAGGESSVADFLQEGKWYEKSFYLQSGVLLSVVGGVISNAILSFLLGNTASSVCVGAAFRVDKGKVYNNKEIFKDAVLGSIVGVKILPIKIGTSGSIPVVAKFYFRFKAAIALNIASKLISGKKLNSLNWTNILISSTLSTF